MRRIKGAKPSPALLVAVVALVAALGGGAVAGVAVTALNKQEKKQVKKISKKQAKKLDKKIALTPGPKGAKGENASNLFAYVGATGNLIYGKGATDASKISTGRYTVGFAQDLEGCVAMANSGVGDPSGSYNVVDSGVVVNALFINGDDTVDVYVVRNNPPGGASAAFSVAVFCP